MKHLINFIANLKATKNLKNLNFIKTKETIELYNLLLKEGFIKINNIVLLSKPGRRRFIPANELRTIDRGLGLTILRTHKGFLTTYQARLLNLGGELFIKII